MRTISRLALPGSALGLALLVSACAPAPGGGAGPTDARAIIKERCTVCHTSERIAPGKHDRAGWESTVDRMIDKGAKLSSAERATLLDFLAKR
jgi:cytochrome c5